MIVSLPIQITDEVFGEVMIQKNYDFADHCVHSLRDEVKLIMHITSLTFFEV